MSRIGENSEVLQDDKHIWEQVGQAYFDALAKHLVTEGEGGWALVCEVRAEGETQVEIVSTAGANSDRRGFFAGQRFLFSAQATQSDEDLLECISHELEVGGYAGAVLKAQDGLPCGVLLLLWENAGSELTQVACLFDEFASRTAAELSLRAERLNSLKRESTYRSMLDSLPTAIFLKDERGRYLDCNCQMEKVWGVSKEHALGKCAFDLLPSDQADACYRSDQRVLALKKPLSLEMALTFGDDGGRRDFILNKVPLCRSDGSVQGVLGCLYDISDRKEAENKLIRLASYENLTGLPNQNLLLKKLEWEIMRAKHNKRKVALLSMDLDGFKIINRTLGQATGENLLLAVAARLQECMGEGQLVACLGGDRFVMLLPFLDDDEVASGVAKRVLDSLAQPYVVDGHDVCITASIGIAVFPDDADDGPQLLHNAHSAISQSKEQGKSSVSYYNQSTNVRAMERFVLGTRLRYALKREEFFLNFQPQVNLETHQVTGVEALLRWEDQELGLLSPSRFIPVAEETGLIIPIGEWVLREACRQNKAWQQAGLPPVCVAVNVSGLQFKQPDFVDLVFRVLDETGLAPHWLELELTETSMVDNTEACIDVLHRLKKRGVRLSIDDFGTGYSSLGYLKRFPIDTLKIDQSFIRHVGRDGDDAAIAEAIIAMAHSLGLKTIGEGVEDVNQLAFLQNRLCDTIQGYLLSRPVSAAETERFLHSSQWVKEKLCQTMQELSSAC